MGVKFTVEILEIWAILALSLNVLGANAADLERNIGDEADDFDEIVVWGRSLRQVGEAQAASEGIVGFADIQTRPLLRPGELVEVIPGMIATQHSGGGKANQYFLRGFNLDHGTDFAGFFDGVPLNLRSHAHMSGYLDINFIIPELIKTVEFQKGVHYANAGDYSAAGSARFSTYDTLEGNFVQFNLTDDGDYRFLVGASVDMGDKGALLGAFQYEGGDGPFEKSEELEKYSVYLKHTRILENGTFRVSLMGYDNTWFATDQIPQRAVDQGLIGRFGSLDPTLGGDTSRYIISAVLEREDMKLNAYVQSYKLNLYGNPTYYIDQNEGDQFVQVDDRWSWGLRGSTKKTVQRGGIDITARIGAGIHTDHIKEVGLYKTENRIRTGIIRNDKATVALADIWGDLVFHWTDRLRTTFGMRIDHVVFDVTSQIPDNSGKGTGTQLSPKFSAAYALSENFELYASYGYGFHTNDPRGVVLSFDPVTGDPSDPVSLFAKSTGGEVGLRFEPSSKFNFSLSVYELKLDSESIFVGDAGTSEPSGATGRSGVEMALFWQAQNWLAFDVQSAWSHARFRDVPDNENRVPNSVGFVAGAGMTVVTDNGWEASLRVRHLGKAALTEDAAVFSNPTTLVNLGISRRLGKWDVGMDILNLLNTADNDITFFYESQLLGETSPVEDIHFHPVHPRAIRFIVRRTF